MRNTTKQLFKHIESQIPKFNEALVGGLVSKQMQFCEQYVDRIFHCAAPNFPAGLRYLRCERCTPQETLQVITAKRGNRQSYELSRSDIYMVKCIFEFNGEELKPRYLYLPYVNDAGLIHLRGSVFAISPVLADHAVSTGVDSIFIPVNRS